MAIGSRFIRVLANDQTATVTQAERNQNMSDQSSLISNAFATFMKEAPQHAQAWGTMVKGLADASALDKKTAALAYLAVLAALRMDGGIPFHVQTAKQCGASREEVISAILVGLPAAGHCVTQVLPTAIAAYDAK
jgi:alkylhydroperoxidase/carboxymuconolactone decarboxylase family protein YurZ